MKCKFKILPALITVLLLASAFLAVNVSAEIDGESEEPTENTSSVIYGDVNGDGEVIITDATMLQKYLANMTKLDEDAIKRADANIDGNVDIKDVTKIQVKVAGKDIDNNPDTTTQPSIETTAPDPTQVLCDQMENQVFDIINAERKKAGVSTINRLTVLDEVSDVRSKELVTLFSHTRPNGGSFFTIYDDIGMDYAHIGENVASGQVTAEEVMTSFMNSPGHRQNILDPKYKSVGLSCYCDNGIYYWVQEFYLGWD